MQVKKYSNKKILMSENCVELNVKQKLINHTDINYLFKYDYSMDGTKIIVQCLVYGVYIDNDIWLCGNMKLTLSVDQNISRVKKVNSEISCSTREINSVFPNIHYIKKIVLLPHKMWVLVWGVINFVYPIRGG